jgi:DNA-binding transcriptional LysR family regulator
MRRPACNVSQPSLSAQIAEAELQLGAILVAGVTGPS